MFVCGLLDHVYKAHVIKLMFIKLMFIKLMFIKLMFKVTFVCVKLSYTHTTQPSPNTSSYYQFLENVNL